MPAEKELQAAIGAATEHGASFSTGPAVASAYRSDSRLRDPEVMLYTIAALLDRIDLLAKDAVDA